MTENEKKAFILLRRKYASSRADIARILGISRPTASTIVRSLIDAGLIVECGKGKSNGGTAPISLTINAKHAFHVGFDLGYADRMAAVLLDNAGDIVKCHEINFSPSDLDDITDKIVSVTSLLAAEHPICGVAVALSGITDKNNMNVLKSINPCYMGENIRNILEKNFDLPFFISNRSRTSAISEAFGGAGDKIPNFALISLGKSIGAAFRCEGEIFNGANCAAGEIRNMRLADGTTFENALADDTLKNLTAEDIAARCADGLSQLADIMDIDFMILSGRFSDFGDTFADKLENIISQQHPVQIHLSRFGRFSAARGAAFSLGELTI